MKLSWSLVHILKRRSYSERQNLISYWIRSHKHLLSCACQLTHVHCMLRRNYWKQDDHVENHIYIQFSAVGQATVIHICIYHYIMVWGVNTRFLLHTWGTPWGGHCASTAAQASSSRTALQPTRVQRPARTNSKSAATSYPALEEDNHLETMHVQTYMWCSPSCLHHTHSVHHRNSWSLDLHLK